MCSNEFSSVAGRQHIHNHIEAARTALVVVDMQHAFVEPGNPSAVPMALQIVPTVNRLAAAMRTSGGTVVWVYTTFDEHTASAWNAFFGGVYNPQFSAAVIKKLSAGNEAHALWHELDIQPADAQFSKDRFSAFLPGHCDLPKYLRTRQIDTVVIAGTVTNVCCESSARDALMQNFAVIMLARWQRRAERRTITTPV